MQRRRVSESLLAATVLVVLVSSTAVAQWSVYLPLIVAAPPGAPTVTPTATRDPADSRPYTVAWQPPLEYEDAQWFYGWLKTGERQWVFTE